MVDDLSPANVARNIAPCTITTDSGTFPCKSVEFGIDVNGEPDAPSRPGASLDYTIEGIKAQSPVVAIPSSDSELVGNNDPIQPRATFGRHDWPRTPMTQELRDDCCLPTTCMHNEVQSELMDDKPATASDEPAFVDWGVLMDYAIKDSKIEWPVVVHTKQLTVYLAGKMTGLKNFGFDVFDAARDDLTARGYKVVSPADIDREIGFDPSVGTLDDFDLPAAIRRDVDAILGCDAIVMLPGHESSKGATAERFVAKWASKPVFSYPDMLPYDEASSPATRRTSPGAVPDEGTAPVLKDEPIDILLEAYNVTRGDRNNQYGPPDQDFRRTAGMWSALFEDLLKVGAVFEPFHIAQAMILLKMSRQLHQRKRDNWTDTAGYARCGQLCDESSQKSHAQENNTVGQLH